MDFLKAKRFKLMIVTFMTGRFCFGHCHFFQIHFTHRAFPGFGVGFFALAMHRASVLLRISYLSVSYTHLDVYKRQPSCGAHHRRDG